MPDTQAADCADQQHPVSGCDDRVRLDAGLRRLEQFQGLIAHADAKAAVIATAAGLLLGATATDTHALRATFAAATGLHSVAQALLALTVVALVAVIVSLGAALTPRIRQARTPNVFAFPSARQQLWRHEERMSVADLAAHAWAHGTLLTHVAEVKYTAVRRALFGIGLAAVGFAAWTGLAVTL